MALLIAALVLYLVLLVAVLAYALWKGGKDERRGALTILAGTLSSMVVAEFGPEWNGPEIGVMTVDALALVALVAIAYRSEKYWPIWAAASQFVAVLTHWVIILNPAIVKTVYATAQPFWIFPILAALAVGTRAHQRSLR